MFKHSMLFSLGLLAATTVHAADADGFYVSAGLGQSQVSFDGTDFNTNSSPSPLTTVDASKKTGDVYGVNVGYSVNRYLAAEVGYVNLGQPVYGYTSSGGVAHSTLNISGLTAAVVGKLPVAANFSLLGSVGLASYSMTRDPYHSWGTNPVGTSKSGTTHLLSIGGEYALTPQLAVVGKYTVFGVMGDEDTVGRVTPSAYSLGLQYSFK
jgi:OmpA-OmpF porin, OOP family